MTVQKRRKELRSFGLIMSLMICLIFGLFLPWAFSWSQPIWPWIVAGSLTLVALLAPGLLEIPFGVWMKVGHVLGWINTRIILTIVFYLLITPMGLMARLFGYDPLRLKRNQSLQSYRVKSSPPEKGSMENPY